MKHLSISTCFFLPCCIKSKALNVADLLSHSVLIDEVKDKFKFSKIHFAGS